MLVNNQTHVESIINPGSQIIAMSDAVCHDLGLHYDPQIQLNMQSMNGTVNKSLGLARNIPCCVGDITLYLQIHIIHDPNLGEVTTIPTLPRGSCKHRFKPDKETQNFHVASRI